ncbi:hypothetical protein QE152_g31253 [Popillia japonica]|uniref:Uncharacterized protein n=1 Tax=Popillia japonica TaxID=7064 RepID=A0AAW1JC80_POPJA
MNTIQLVGMRRGNVQTCTGPQKFWRAPRRTGAEMGQSSAECDPKSDPKDASSFASCYHCQRRQGILTALSAECDPKSDPKDASSFASCYHCQRRQGILTALKNYSLQFKELFQIQNAKLRKLKRIGLVLPNFMEHIIIDFMLLRLFGNAMFSRK